MLDPVVNFFTRMFQWIGRGIGHLVSALAWPFVRAGRWYRERGWILKTVVGAVLVVIVGLWANFIYATQWWNGFDPDYVNPQSIPVTRTVAGDTAAGGSATADGTDQPPATAESASCNPSEIAAMAAELIDFNVNRNAWISSMLLSKLGFFGIPWRNTPFFDNKAAFQLGINQVLRRTTTELVDTLGRVRGTSQIDQNLQDARTALAWDETAWYIGLRGPTRPTPSVYRGAIDNLRGFNASLEQCRANFDARADNLLLFLDRIAGDIGSTSDILQARTVSSNAGWFDPRADDRFWFAYGQLYAYYGILTATRSDFSAIVAERNLSALWRRMEEQLRTALDMQPAIVSNGNESSFLFPSHLANMGFHLLRVRSQLIEIRSVLDR